MSALIAGARIERICRSSRLSPCSEDTRNSAYHPARLTLAAGFGDSSATVVAICFLPLPHRSSPSSRSEDGEVAEAARPLTEGFLPLHHPLRGRSPSPFPLRGNREDLISPLQRRRDRFADRRGWAARERAQVLALAVE